MKKEHLFIYSFFCIFFILGMTSQYLINEKHVLRETDVPDNMLSSSLHKETTESVDIKHYHFKQEESKMPLNTGKAAKTKKGFSENVATEIKSGKPKNQAVAIAYREKRQAQKKR